MNLLSELDIEKRPFGRFLLSVFLIFFTAIIGTAALIFLRAIGVWCD